MFREPSIGRITAGILAIALGACAPAGEGGNNAPAAENAEAADAGETAAVGETGGGMEGSDAPRVYFENVEDGGTYTSPVTLRFGVENYEITPVVEGENPPGAGHFHVSIDSPCIPQGEVIPQGQGYIHFGDGTAEIETQLTPGEHTLCLQIGDGEHRVPAGEEYAGLTREITITIEEG